VLCFKFEVCHQLASFMATQGAPAEFVCPGNNCADTAERGEVGEDQALQRASGFQLSLVGGV